MTYLAIPKDRLRAIEASKKGKISIYWSHNGISPRRWAVKQGWSLPFFGFKKSFVEKMFESDENFKKALIDSGIDLWITT